MLSSIWWKCPRRTGRSATERPSTYRPRPSSSRGANPIPYGKIPQELCGVHRRHFNLGILKISAAAFLSPRLLANPFDDTNDDVPEAIEALYKTATVIDSLCGPFVAMDVLPSAETVAAVHHSGITAIHSTVSVPGFEDTINILANLQDLVDHYPEALLIVRRHSDLIRAKRENKIGIMPGFQDTQFLEEDPD